MVMGCGIGIVSIKGAAEIYFTHQSLFNENIQVSVNGSHAQIRKLLFYLIVNPACGGMYSRVQEQLIYTFSLSAFLVFWLQGALSVSIIFGIIINIKTLCVKSQQLFHPFLPYSVALRLHSLVCYASH